MKNFTCSNCGNRVYFENSQCVRCGHALGFDADTLGMVSLADEAHHYCANATYAVCNWLAGDTALCQACDLNRTIPNLSEAGSLEAWRDLERAKKRLVYSLLRFGLRFDVSAPKGPLSFNFVRSALTGHLDGQVTIDIMEADAVERERQRQQFGEPYRSLLGHLRHECGHYFWAALLEDGARLDEFRALFGDERSDYGAAIQRHHSLGASHDWSLRFVSAYASAHPWEDWAETWAHYLHMVDTLDTADASGMEPRIAALAFGPAWPFKSYDIYREETFEALIERWVPLTLSLNGLSRSMGHDDFYPFVIPAPAKEKLAFVHRTIRERPT